MAKFITRDSGKRIKFKSGLMRDIDFDKPRYDLIYLPFLTRIANLLSRGVKKYGEEEWSKANSKEELKLFKQKAFRHFIDWMENEEDEDHASAIFINLMIVEYLKDKGFKW